MDRLKGKVALVTGAARGQGRSHAIHLADEGADIIAFDICADIASNEYPLATRDDLDETVKLVEKSGQRVIAAVVDVRDRAAMAAALDEAVAQLGGLHVVVANAGICPQGNHIRSAASLTRSTSTLSESSTPFTSASTTSPQAVRSSSPVRSLAW